MPRTREGGDINGWCCVVSEQVYAIKPLTSLRHENVERWYNILMIQETTTFSSRSERFDIKEVAVTSGDGAQGTPSCTSRLGTLIKRLPLWADLWSSVSSGIDQVAACQSRLFRGAPITDTRSREARCGTRRAAVPCHCSLLTPAVQNRASLNLL